MKIRPLRLRNQALPGGRGHGHPDAEDGFTLLENLLALSVLTFGLLASGHMIAAAFKSAALAQAKTCAILTAQSKVEYLADRYQHDPSGTDFATGRHGPEIQNVVDPVGGTVWNRFEITWTMADVPGPRADSYLAARLLTVEVRPVTDTGNPNSKAWLNKELSLSTILSRWEMP